MPGEQQFIIDESQEGGVMDLKGRNSKTPKKANHGARPCSSVMRKLKRQGWFKKITSLWSTNQIVKEETYRDLMFFTYDYTFI